MAAKRRSRSRQAGPRGPRGKTGPVGPAGPPGNGDVKKLADQIAEVMRQLQVQLTRISQIQTQLDRLASGQSPDPERRKIPRTEH